MERPNNKILSRASLSDFKLKKKKKKEKGKNSSFADLKLLHFFF